MTPGPWRPGSLLPIAVTRTGWLGFTTELCLSFELVPARGLEGQGCGFSSLPGLQQQGGRQWVEWEPQRHFAIKWCNLVSARCFDFAQLCLCAFRLILLAGRSRAACCLSRALVWFLLDMQLSWRGTLQPRSLLWLGSFRQTCLGVGRESCWGQAAVFLQTLKQQGKGPVPWSPSRHRRVAIAFCQSRNWPVSVHWFVLLSSLRCVLVACNEQKTRNSSSPQVTGVSWNWRAWTLPLPSPGKVWTTYWN